MSSSFRRSFLQDESSMAMATARAGNVIGDGDWAQYRLIPDCIRSINKQFVKFLDCAVEGTVNICTGKQISVGDFGKTIAKKMNKTHLLEILAEETTQPPPIVGDI